MHPVTQPLGSGSGLVLVGKENSPDVWMSLCVALATITPWRSGSTDSSVISGPYTGDKVSVLGFNLC